MAFYVIYTGFLILDKMKFFSDIYVIILKVNKLPQMEESPDYKFKIKHYRGPRRPYIPTEGAKMSAPTLYILVRLSHWTEHRNQTFRLFKSYFHPFNGLSLLDITPYSVERQDSI